ncbi:DNA-binding protein [Shewanella yunxiaonensis]|uniref:DNA-binding protein n=1 Tax=Shewanella yunxiaonensis TaxID=2829809 RepID=A0ABX7YTD3_9GAMM|nr:MULTISPECIES: DNA-binding protein [Shewanella]MDF0534626.1 DNA-binding protein [Shewanella sp. A32]QUN05998.1 DNA-binding protein [Shewanella yunxiaonensis]
MAQWLICIDDTDDIGTKGTGEIAGEIADLLQVHGGSASLVTRHQLFVHEDIPYTSHNSAMCFAYEGPLSGEEIKAIAVAHLCQESAAAADPGLAFVYLPHLKNALALQAFGQSAKQQVLTKAAAYELARELQIDLSEHGGTGQGVIGALAGLGLRLSGNDGRVKGQLKFGQGETPQPFSVADILQQGALDGVLTTDGDWLAPETQVWLSGKVKAVMAQGRFALLVSQQNGDWHNATKQQLKDY